MGYEGKKIQHINGSSDEAESMTHSKMDHYIAGEIEVQEFKCVDIH